MIITHSYYHCFVIINSLLFVSFVIHSGTSSINNAMINFKIKIICSTNAKSIIISKKLKLP